MSGQQDDGRAGWTTLPLWTFSAKRKRRTNGDIADVMLEKENLLSMSHNAMIPLPFLTASTEAEIVCIVDVKGNIRERERPGRAKVNR